MPTLEDLKLTGSLRPNRRDDDTLLYRAYRLAEERGSVAVVRTLKELESGVPGETVDNLRKQLKEACDTVLGFADPTKISAFQWMMREDRKF